MDKNVFRLYISMDNIAIMHELYSMADLPYHCSDFLLLKSSLFPQRSIYVPPATRLQNQIKVFFIAEVSIKLNYVWMIQKALNFNFSHKLVDEPRLPFEDFFGNFLEGTDEIYLLMPTLKYKITQRDKLNQTVPLRGISGFRNLRW